MYRTVDTAFWTDPRVRILSPEAKLLFLYLITNTHTHVSGIYYLPNVIVTYETGLPAKGLDALWDTLSIGYPTQDGAGLVRRDKKNEVVWVVNMFRYQGRGIKALISASHHLKTLHKSFLCKEFAEKYPEVTTVNNGYRIDTLSIGYPSQDGEGSSGTGTGTGTEEEYPPTPLTGGAGPSKPKRQSKPSFDPRTFPLPTLLDVPAFRETWGEWIAAREQMRKRLTEIAVKKQLAMLSELGPDSAIRCINHSLRNGYQGLIDPREKNGRAPEPPPKPTPRIFADQTRHEDANREVVPLSEIADALRSKFREGAK